MLIFWFLNLEPVDLQTFFYYEKVLRIYHSINLPFDAEVTEKFLNGIYFLVRTYAICRKDKGIQS